MTTEMGTCPYCDEANSYQNLNCSRCGEQLPWAAWNQAERDAPAAIGATPVDPSQLRNWESQNPVGISLSGAPFMRLISVVTALLVTVAIGYFAYNAVTRQNSSGANANKVQQGYSRYGNQLDRQMDEK